MTARESYQNQEEESKGYYLLLIMVSGCLLCVGAGIALSVIKKLDIGIPCIVIGALCTLISACAFKDARDKVKRRSELRKIIAAEQTQNKPQSTPDATPDAMFNGDAPPQYAAVDDSSQPILGSQSNDGVPSYSSCDSSSVQDGFYQVYQIA